MEQIRQKTDYFGTEKISRILLKLAPPVMLAQLIQALYNIIDSLFVGRFSDSGLTALSIIYPLQLLMIALAVGTGVGINTVMAAKLGLNQSEKADEYAGIGTPLAVILWAVLAVVCYAVMPAYVKMQTGKHLDEDPTGARQYENADDCADYWCGDKYHTGSAADFRHRRTAAAWHYWCSDCNCHRTDCGSIDRYAPRIP